MMIYVYRKFNRLLLDKQQKLGRPLSFEEVATEAKVPLAVVERMATNSCFTLTLGTIDRLLRYFKLSDIGELVEYESDVEI